MSQLIQIWNQPMSTTTVMPGVSVGNSVHKTLLQVKLGTQNKGKVVEWGISFSGATPADPVIAELVETGTVFGTVTAHVASGLVLFGDPNDIAPDTSNFILGTTATGYTASAEGTIVATRLFDSQYVPNTGGYVKQFPLGREPVVNVSTALRVRVYSPVAGPSARCYVTIEI